MSESLRVRATRRAARETFPLWRRLGLHVTAAHFYEPVPDTRHLPESTWESSDLVGIEMNDSAQVELLTDFARRFGDEYGQIPAEPTSDRSVFALANPSFGSVDAEILYSMVRSLAPRRVLEVGSGFTSLLIAQALQANAGGGHASSFTAVDPYPNSTISAGLPGLTRVVESPVQRVPMDEFEALEDGDILFIDSSHVLGIGTDVQYLFLEVVPRLAPGVSVHIHDIFLPAEYPRAWVEQEHRFWNEQYLLQAFLSFNDSWDVVWAGNYMHENHSSELAEAISSYRPGRLPGSFWMRRRTPTPTRSTE